MSAVCTVLFTLTLICACEALPKRRAQQGLGNIDLGSLFSGGSSDCDFVCPTGFKKEPNTAHKPRTNGCGTDFLRVSDQFNFTPCCDQHDICYDQCNLPPSFRNTCDKQFLVCMENLCKTNYETKKAEECRSTAALYHTATTSFGCSLYKKSQKEACVCKPTNKEL